MGDVHSTLLPALPPHLPTSHSRKEKASLKDFFFFLLCKRVCPEFLLLLHIFPSIMFSSVLIKFSSEVVIFTGCQLHTAGLASSPTNHGSNGFTICTWGLAACVTSVELTWKKKNSQDSYCTAILSRRRGISVCGQMETAETRGCK